MERDERGCSPLPARRDTVERGQRFTVLSGTLASHVNGVERVHEAGEVVVAPAGSVHTVRNAGYRVVHALVEFRSALHSEVVLQSLAGLARDGKTN
jgi:quercetin dioxygenase-like cupin family protein